MACLLRLPDQSSKGVVTFTTQEHFFLKNNPEYRRKFDWIRSRYLVGLHFNWHDFSFQKELDYDFLMAGENDLIDKSSRRVETLNLDACNFSPACMDFGTGEKHWDILYVARGVFFKGIESFFDCIRTLYDSGHRYRVLFLCPAPPENLSDTEALIRHYESLFKPEERKLFNFLVLRENYPFFFDLPTLAHFYKASRVFVHTADQERRCRVAAYAFCCGLPVVGMECVGSILSPEAREKIFFEVASQKEFPAEVVKALNSNLSGDDFSAARRELSEVYAVDALKSRLGVSDGHWFTRHLDIRLGRHHGFGPGPNSLPYTLSSFMEMLMHSGIGRPDVKKAEDVEAFLSGDHKGISVNRLSVGFRLRHGTRLFLSRTKNSCLRALGRFRP